MQFFILLLGALVFVFYQFEPPPVFFNQTEWRQHEQGADAAKFHALDEKFHAAFAEKQLKIRAWLDARAAHDATAESAARTAMIESQTRAETIRTEAKNLAFAQGLEMIEDEGLLKEVQRVVRHALVTRLARRRLALEIGRAHV